MMPERRNLSALLILAQVPCLGSLQPHGQSTSPAQGRGSGGHVPALLSKGEQEKGMRAECCCHKDTKHSSIARNRCMCIYCM
jgi:hypothetical protein